MFKINFGVTLKVSKKERLGLGLKVISVKLQVVANGIFTGFLSKV